MDKERGDAYDPFKKNSSFAWEDLIEGYPEYNNVDFDAAAEGLNNESNTKR